MTPAPAGYRWHRLPAASALPYRLLVPEAMVADKIGHPLVLFLHGAGERGLDDGRQLSHLPQELFEHGRQLPRPPILLAPQCPPDARWVDVPWDAPAHTLPSQPSNPMRQLLAWLDDCAGWPGVDARRIYALGLSMGGFGVWDLLARRPDTLAAAVPICGGGDPATAARFAATPVWAAHGTLDPVVPVARSRQMVAALQAQGGAVHYSEYAGLGHAAWQPALRDPDLLAWLFAQQRAAA